MSARMKMRDRGKTNLTATIEVGRRITVPISTQKAKTTDLVRELVGAGRLTVLSGPQKHGRRMRYQVSVRRSATIPDKRAFRRVLRKLLITYGKCSTVAFRPAPVGLLDVDSRRPNVTSEAFVYCLRHRNAFTRRVLALIKAWLADEYDMKWALLRTVYDERLVVSTPQATKRDIRELEETVETRRVYLKCLSYFDVGEYEEALAVAQEHKFC